ncbi:DUF1223 domain-containing protein [Bacteriovoracaceae bacterium]|nr:DUF1223 domain-containing protein [Bacteriovoracaceae bacterium]
MKLTIFLILFSNALKAVEIEFKSGSKKVHLIELYTSESCSSCPPAEAWMNSFKAHPKLWKEFVPVEFHVDYWNYLSWVDKYSQKEYSKRQRNYHKILSAGVYTPQFIHNAQDWRSWQKRKLPTDKKMAPELKVNLNQTTGQVKFLIKTSKKNLNCHVALMGGGVSSKVKSGENKGKILQHEFAVLEYRSVTLSSGKCETKINLKPRLKTKNYSIAFWISDNSSFQIIQATGGALKLN